MKQSFFFLALLITLTGCASFGDGLWKSTEPAARSQQQDILSSEPLTSSSAANYLSAIHANRANDFSAATGFIANLDDPGSTILTQKLILTVIDGNMASAFDQAGLLPEKGSDESLNHLILAIRAIEAEEFAKAEEIYAKASDQFSGAFIKPLITAWIKAGQGKKADSLAEIKKLENLEALTPLQNLHTGLLYLYFEEALMAKPYLEEVLETLKDANIRYVMLALDYYLRIYDLPKAQAVLEDVKAREPDSEFINYLEDKLNKGDPWISYSAKKGAAAAFYDVGTIFASERRPRQGLFYGQLANYLDPTNPINPLFVANLFRQLQRFDESNRTYRQANLPDPFRFTAIFRQAENLFFQEKFAEAAIELENLLSLYPDRSDVHVLLGDIYRNQKQYLQAAAEYGKAINLTAPHEPRHWTLFYARGVAYERGGKWAKAEADLKQSIVLDPKQPTVLNYLGYSWIDMGINIEEGKDLILKAVELSPSNGFIVDSYGWVLYTLKEYEQAALILEKAVRLEPSDAVIVDHYGDALWQTGRHQEAKFMWSQALSFNPADDAKDKIIYKLQNGLQ